MARDQVTICNNALGSIPADLIETIDDSTLSARTMKRLWDNVITDLLEHHDFDFAIKRAVPAAVTNTRDGEWLYAFRLPNDVLSPMKVMPVIPNANIPWGYTANLDRLRQGLPFEIADGIFFTNEEFPTLEYVTSDVGVADFTSLFGRAVEAELAARGCVPITNDRQRERDLQMIAFDARERAVADDLNRKPSDMHDYVSAREVVRGGGEPLWG